MSASALEILLARLYGSPLAYALGAGLSVEQMPDVLAIDAAALRFAARSYERKRGQRSGQW